jgi:N utilization substance protein A
VPVKWELNEGFPLFCFYVRKTVGIMNNPELIRIVENLARDRKIERESIFADLEEAMMSAAKKYFGKPDLVIEVHIDRTSGDITAFKNGEQLDIRQLGRIPAQAAKQVMIQKIRADERTSIFTEYVQRKHEIISGTVVRYESERKVSYLNRSK